MFKSQQWPIDNFLCRSKLLITIFLPRFLQNVRSGWTTIVQAQADEAEMERKRGEEIEIVCLWNETKPVCFFLVKKKSTMFCFGACFVFGCFMQAGRQQVWSKGIQLNLFPWAVGMFLFLLLLFLRRTGHQQWWSEKKKGEPQTVRVGIEIQEMPEVQEFLQFTRAIPDWLPLLLLLLRFCIFFSLALLARLTG